ncbi:DNA-entry nuclease [Paenibacillus cremeus]
MVLVFAVVLYFYNFESAKQTSTGQQGTEITIEFPSERFPETAAHIKSAIEHGEPSICTMAVCKEGGKGADIAYVAPSDNRGAGSWVSNQLEKYPDGTRVQIVVK